MVLVCSVVFNNNDNDYLIISLLHRQRKSLVFFAVNKVGDLLLKGRVGGLADSELD
jgi:hypothetical protein